MWPKAQMLLVDQFLFVVPRKKLEYLSVKKKEKAVAWQANVHVGLEIKMFITLTEMIR